MANQDELLKRKALAIYQILLWFVIVDWSFDPEEEELIIWYIMQNYSILDRTEISLEEQIKHLADEEDNFMNNAIAISMTSSKEEQIEILLFISTIMFADKEFSDREYELFTKLTQAWHITNDDLKI